MDSMMYNGTKHTLDEQDLWDLPAEESAEGLSSKLGYYWKQQLQKKRLVTP